MNGPQSRAVVYTIVSPILKKPLVCGTYKEKTMVTALTRDVKIAVIANRIAVDIEILRNIFITPRVQHFTYFG